MSTKVLIIDDDEFFRDALCEFLNDGSIEIIYRCASYLEAKELYSSGRLKDVDAIILDLMLPYKKDQTADSKVGLVILEELRARHGFNGPIVVLTNSRDSVHGEEALARGCTGYLCKHATADAIPRLVSELTLALTGEVVLVSSSLKHLIVKPDATGQKEAADGRLMNMLGHNAAWLEVKEGLGFSTEKTQQHEKRPLRPVSDWQMQRNSTPGGFSGASASLVKHLLESAPRAILITTRNGDIVFSNYAAEQMFGLNQNQLLGDNVYRLFPQMKPDKRFGARNGDEGFVKTNSAGELEFYAKGPGGTFPISVASSTFEEGKAVYSVYIFTDLTSQKTTEERLKALVSELEASSRGLEQLVRTDPLTGLLNRRGLESVLKRELSLAKRNRTEVVGVLIDLDDFKSINDQHGHAAGDIVLKGIADALRETLRTSDWLGRIGGDEFMVFLPSTSLENAVLIAERVRLCVATKKMIKGEVQLHATVSIGVAVIPPEGNTLEQVLELTRFGLKSSKRSGKNIVSISRNYLNDASMIDDKPTWNEAIRRTWRRVKGWCTVGSGTQNV